MGAPDKGMEAAEQPAAETLLTAFKTISAGERRKHASVLNYWLSIRGSKEFPPLHDFDPLEISDFGPSSMLVEIMGSGSDAEIRHLGEALKADGMVERIADAPNPSLLASIARKLPIVEISRDFLAFEDDFTTANGSTNCWVTLLPLSSTGAWVDYVYAFVSVETVAADAAEAPPEEEPVEEVVLDEVEGVSDAVADEPETAVEPLPIGADLPDDMPEEETEPAEAAIEEQPEEAFIEEQEPPAESAVSKIGPGFAKLFEGFAGLTGFYDQSAKAEPVADPSSEPEAAEPEVFEPEADPVAVEESAVEPEAIEEPANEEPAVVEEPAIEQPVSEQPEQVPASEGTLQNKLDDVRAKADEARAAKLQANLALYEGLGAAYDFALDAEDSPEEYLRLVEGQGLKIQLRAPMAPVVKLAFDGLCDESVIAQLEAVMAWALKQELPRGTLAGRIDEAGGIAGILNGQI
jgi:hypothetical protein